ncbi:MAG: hypothetical protein ACMVP2_28000 [Imperialibacter sp.]|uniref:hypothetical protein n=1 Tax=Imperialibacter sp. TaxID=2038411 RepID=UPI003A898A7E
MKRLVMFVIFQVLVASQIFGQDSDAVVVKKNVIYVHGGIFNYNGGYERSLITLKSGMINAKAAVGKSNAPDHYGKNLMLAAGYLHGKKSHHLDADMGIGYFSNNTGDFSEFFLVGHLGYRYQKPGGLLVIKVGSGAPEGLYLGLGLAF